MNRPNFKSRRGQGMTEYIIIVALIAIAAIGVITTFGDDIRQIFATSTDALSGNTSATNKAQHFTDKEKNLKNFGEDNTGVGK